MRCRWVGIEAGRDGVLELPQERVAIAAVADVVADRRGLGVVEHHEVRAAAGVERLGCRGARLLVPVPCRG